jgi:WD40 repeat protein
MIRKKSLFARMRDGFTKSRDDSIPPTPPISTTDTTTKPKDTIKAAMPIRVTTRHKRETYLKRLHLVQELHIGPSGDSATTPTSATTARGIWAMQFSKCGRYLAASGQDHIVRVWCLATAETSQVKHLGNKIGVGSDMKHNDRLANNGMLREIFCSQPMRVWEGHTGDVLELSWSKVYSYHAHIILIILMHAIK